MMTEGFSRPSLRINVVFHHDHAVDEDILEPGGIMMRVLERGSFLDFLRIKCNEVGPVSRLHQAAIGNPISGGRQRSHSADGIFEAQQSELTHVTAEQTRIVAVSPRM